MPRSASEYQGRRQWRWWIPDYPERLGRRDIGQIAATLLLTVLFGAAAIGTWSSGSLAAWLSAVAAVLGLVGLVGIGIGLRRDRRRERT